MTTVQEYGTYYLQQIYRHKLFCTRFKHTDRRLPYLLPLRPHNNLHLNPYLIPLPHRQYFLLNVYHPPTDLNPSRRRSHLLEDIAQIVPRKPGAAIDDSMLLPLQKYDRCSCYVLAEWKLNCRSWGAPDRKVVEDTSVHCVEN